jgi:hypothetical protein
VHGYIDQHREDRANFAMPSGELIVRLDSGSPRVRRVKYPDGTWSDIAAVPDDLVVVGNSVLTWTHAGKNMSLADPDDGRIVRILATPTDQVFAPSYICGRWCFGTRGGMYVAMGTGYAFVKDSDADQSVLAIQGFHALVNDGNRGGLETLDLKTGARQPIGSAPPGFEWAADPKAGTVFSWSPYSGVLTRWTWTGRALLQDGFVTIPLGWPDNWISALAPISGTDLVVYAVRQRLNFGFARLDSDRTSTRCIDMSNGEVRNLFDDSDSRLLRPIAWVGQKQGGG